MAREIDENQKGIIKEAVQHFVDAQLQDQELDIDEFVKKYPGLERQIRQSIQDVQKIDTLFASLVHVDENDFDAIATGHDLTGRKIGSFEIGEMIGRGGMGVVYLAHDTKLDRSVAIKSMPAELQANSTAQMRFKREAKLLASLNHPNIAVIHDIIEQDTGSGYLVLEYIPGQTLTERIAHKPLKLEDALSIGQQIAEALLGAYEHGVIHRDLKPGNVKITPEGRVKVLDFGLAKASGTQDEKAESIITQPGRIVGTPAYMSPEQARGNPTDHCTDIWSFGCVMYEMLTGHLPFEGETATDTVARVLEREPDWLALPQKTPANIRVMLRRCLEKNPRQRLQHIGDAVIEINETLNLPRAVPPVTTSSASNSPATDKRLLIGVMAACLVLVAMAASLTTWILKPSASPLWPAPVRFPITLPQSQQAAYSSPLVGKLALSPDGGRIAYIASENGVNQLFVRELDSVETRRISGTEDAHSPFFSPDGWQLAVIKASATSDIFVGQLARPALTKITDNPSWDLWPVWGPVSKRITYGSARVDNNHVPSLFSVSADGSAEEPLTEGNPKKGQLPCSWSGDEQKLAFVSIGGEVGEFSSFDIWVLSMEEGRQAREFLATRYNEKMPAFHPRGDWIAYASDISGRYEVYVRRYPSGNDRRQISFDRGDEPIWDPSGKMLYYRSGNTMKAVAIEIEPSFSLGEPNDLFTEWAERNNMVRNYDFDPVNRRFIMVKPLQEESTPTQINVVLNWFEELKRLVPPGKDL
jgi:serine/threonine protein kinase